MENIQTPPATDKKEVFIKMVLSNWQTQYSRLNDLFNKLSDEQLAAEASPDRNTGVYLLGHMAAVHDAMLPLLGFGDRLYPELDEVFIQNPDKSGLPKPATSTLREAWQKVSDTLQQHIDAVEADEWFTKHNSISEADFAKEPHRNKLNIIINRTNHLSMHLGQLLYLTK
jgi:hypothetical protein